MKVSSMNYSRGESSPLLGGRIKEVNRGLVLAH